MSRKDLLAAGAHKAQFAGGVGDNDIFRNVAPDSGEAIEEVIQPFVKPEAPKLRYNPRHDSVLVRRTEVAASSVLITDTMDKDKPSEGVVIVAGPKSDLKQGDKVVFGKYSGTEFKLNGEVLLILTDEEITGTLTPIESQSVSEVFPGLETVGYIGKA